MSPHACTEEQLVERPAIGLFAALSGINVQALRRTRAPLLPRLPAGEIDVEGGGHV